MCRGIENRVRYYVPLQMHSNSILKLQLEFCLCTEVEGKKLNRKNDTHDTNVTYYRVSSLSLRQYWSMVRNPASDALLGAILSLLCPQ